MATTIQQHRRSFLWIAFAASLLVHVSVLVMAQVVRDRGWLLTQFREQWVRAEQRQPVEDDEESPTPEEELLQPGILNGAPAVITWIGYEEYVEHLAREAQTEQAAFEMSDVPGVNDNGPAAQSSAGGGEDASVEVASSDEVERKATNEDRDTASVESVREDDSAAVNEVDEERVNASMVRTPEAVVEESVEKAAVETSAAESEGASVEVATGDEAGRAEIVEDREAASVESMREDDSAGVNRKSAESEDASAILTPEAVVEVSNESAGTGDASGDGEAIGDSAPRDPGGADKYSPATSTRQVHEIEWDNGKPLAVEGVEILPYSLFRHIMLDSKDVLFGRELNHGRWAGRVMQNPIVSIRFNRYGQVGEVHIVRKSGFAPLDNQYLVSWISRWRARDASLAMLPEGGLTAPLVLRIGFIEEKKEDAAPGGS